MPARPSVESPEENPWWSWWVTCGIRSTWLNSAQPISRAWVARKTRKTGNSACTDSLTPRRLRPISSTITAASTGSFQTARWGGRKLKMALPPPAIETVMVST